MVSDLALLVCAGLDHTYAMRLQGLTPDPWQAKVLTDASPRVLLKCARQSGKSTIVACMIANQLFFAPGSLVLIVAPSERQSCELLRKVKATLHAFPGQFGYRLSNDHELELESGSRVVALPAREETIRSFSGVNLLVIDEAARVPDALYNSVRPMLAVSQGRLVALSTPFGRKGWFYREWVSSAAWLRISIPWRECPRISPTFITEELQSLGPVWVEQEYECSFTSTAGLVYPGATQIIRATFPPEVERQLQEVALWPVADTPRSTPVDRRLEKDGWFRRGGIDFGWHNPFAAVWGVVSPANVLYIGHERYLSECPIEDHADNLPTNVAWACDPSSPQDITALRRRDFVVNRGHNKLAPGIAAVTERMRRGCLFVASSCTALLREFGLYRWPSEAERHNMGEQPIDCNNHALAALRYLVSRLPPLRHGGLSLGSPVEPTPRDKWLASFLDGGE